MNSDNTGIEAKLWGATSALLFSASVGHALRLVELGWTLSGPGHPLGGRDYVALAAIVAYGLVAGLVWAQKRLALWVGVIGPLVGVSSVLLIPGASVDLFQVVLGIIQFVGIATSIGLLWLGRKRSVSSSPGA